MRIKKIGNRRELMVDRYLIDTFDGEAALKLHNPVRREIVLVTDLPWEGNMCGFITVFEDDGRFRMYYKGWESQIEDGAVIHQHGLNTCYAESSDGIHWEKPELGVVEFDGNKNNNIVWQSGYKETLIPFRDDNPDAESGVCYKAFGRRNVAPGRRQLFAFGSPDGIHWDLLQEEPTITEGVTDAAFDSPNLAFWDSVGGIYRAYFRDWDDGRRDIKTATSEDFLNWSDPEWLQYPGAPAEQLYTSQVQPYGRAPHILVGFPTRYVERPWSRSIEALPELEHRRMRSSATERFGTALTDGLFMSSRDGVTFRRWGEAFIRPGSQLEGNWAYGDNYQSKGMLETVSNLPGAPSELSFYAPEGYWRGDSTLFRRYTLRMDGFVSVNAPLSGGEILTRPLEVDGDRLVLNFATSAAGSIQVELQNQEKDPIAGFSLEECDHVIGDELDRCVTWNGDSSIGSVTDNAVRMRIVLSDADLYAFEFQN
ncbi:MAG: hypothetical protein KGZ25_04010 [Planctomycetes bacterium]|nr:hypothetical protein [Planctomycetota bacterium]